MSLATLNRHDRDTAKAILAAAVLSRHGDRPQSENFGKEIDQLIDEIRIELHIRSADKSMEALRKIEGRLFAELTNLVMSGVDKSDTKNALGTAGKLPLSAYRITFIPQFSKHFKESKKTIEANIRSADMVQHLLGSTLAENIQRGMTLVAVWQMPKNSNPHWLLIDSMREETSLSVAAAWRVYPHIVALENVTSPLDILSQFVSHYGTDFIRSGIGPQKMIKDTVVDSPPGEGQLSLFGQGHYLEVGYELEVTDNEDDNKTLMHEYRVVMGYAIDFDKYEADRQREEPTKR